ncbi:MAG: two-component sensor histidine kinase [Alphaproteobacteria bacterium CG11_big_fil_rev_8_21_14_0_20_44_7]|nr:MAG: two-component sensor histidine kinase [Alphaproteobacteria bacterium CG11_big_fil_rev_8_21_14_0_20_44_7]
MLFNKKAFSRLLPVLKQIPLGRVLTSVLLTATIISAVFTYVVLTNPSLIDFTTDPAFQSSLLIVNLGLLLLLAILISRKLVKLWLVRGTGRKGSRLLLKLVFMFSLVAIVPAIIVGLSSSYYLNLGIKSWFDERVSHAIVESVAVADAYLEEHKKVINADAVNLANEISNNAIQFAFNQEKLNNYLTMQATRRLLAEIVLFQDEKVVASSQIGMSLDPLQSINPEKLAEAEGGNVVVLSDSNDKVTAIVKMNTFNDTYLLVSRFVDSRVVSHTRRARGAAAEYMKLKRQIADFQINSTIFFVIIALFLLLAAVWVAFLFADKLVAPISNLVSATDRIKRGEFTVRVKENSGKDEIGTLSHSFNQMAEELEKQKRGVIIANREAEEKRQFNEALLGSISSGVIAINEDKRIELLNASAKEHLSLGDNALGKYLKDVIPEFNEAFEEFRERPTKALQKQVTLRRKAKRMTYNVRVNPHMENNAEGYVMTFDDVSELLSAQRSAAWSDVARKIAHEIKNPLTPINLSAQRLAKKFLKTIPEEDKENFEGYTNTITRHTADIARIIGEFSDFAKLPGPKFTKTDISELLKDAIFSAKVAHSKITFDLDMPDKMMTIADAGQVTQVLTNVIKNAAESVKAVRKTGGKISMKAEYDNEIIITIKDNGGGFPEELLDRLTEPYVTTRQKGTGLGLAIVKKIMEDHSGKIELSNVRSGAQVVLTLPVL